jgi:hypothetical protein
MSLRPCLYVVAGLLFSVATGCASSAEGVTDEDGEDATADSTAEAVTARAGENSGYCVRSAYNCSVRDAKGIGQRVGENHDETFNGRLYKTELDESGHHRLVTVYDGFGAAKGQDTFSGGIILDYGQMRHFDGEDHAYALSTPFGPGWIKLSDFQSAERASIVKNDRALRGHAAGLEHMPCYTLRSSSRRPVLDPDGTLKVEYDYSKPDGEPNDYLPHAKGGNAMKYTSMIFNVPGNGIGGPSMDSFPPGAHFHRLGVTTWGGSSSQHYLDAKVYAKDSAGHFRKVVTTMRFYYGYVETKSDLRTGWIAADALDSGCR